MTPYRVTISYTDSFSDGINRGTLAHATSVNDADNFVSTFKYHYDIGAITRSQDPKGAVQTIQYDTFGRVQRVTNDATNGYTRWEYTSAGELVTFTRVDPSQPETLSVHYVDGAGRDRGTISHLPNSTGQWRAKMCAYDIMGRVNAVTNPTEVTQAWIPTGDDAAGWTNTQQTYNWQGRPRVTTNQDGSTRQTLSLASALRQSRSNAKPISSSTFANSGRLSTLTPEVLLTISMMRGHNV